MTMKANIAIRIALLIALTVSVTVLSARLQADTGTCGGASTTLPFTDVVAASNVFFCSIAEAYFSGLTNGTTPTTYSPGASVPRDQMAAFVSRTLDQSVKRSGRRASLDQFWTNQGANNLALTTVGANPQIVQSDGADLWVASSGDNTVSRVRASDGKLLGAWTGADSAVGVLCALGKVFVTGETSPAKLYQIDPTLAPGMVTTLGNPPNLGVSPESMAFDGQKIWTANIGPPGSVSIITPSPIAITTVTAGFTSPQGLIYDGANIWVTDNIAGTVDKLHKLSSVGGILLSVDVGNTPRRPAFDGTNIWVPHQGGTSDLIVVRANGALAGTVLATLTGNGLLGSISAAFDGERILVTNLSGNSVSVWKASDFTPIGTFSTGAGTVPVGACSDGLNFWITLNSTGKLARF